MEPDFARLLPDDVDPAAALYVADRQLNVVYTNAEWRSFAAGNKGQKLLGEEWNRSVLENFSGKQKARWTAIYQLLLEGRIPHHEEDFICSSPVERRIHNLRITPIKDESGTVRWLVHHAVPVATKPDAKAALQERLRRVDGDAAEAESAYREHVLARKITIPRYEVAQHIRPLEELGGDVLWHRRYPQGVTDVVHADVSGHGNEAGRHAAKMVLILDALGAPGAAVAELVSALNCAMFDAAPEDDVVFATGLLIRFHAEAQRLTCANFGHHGPIFSRSGVIRLEGGLPVGIAPEIEPWPETEILLAEHGNRFLVFSDGITEQFNIEGEMFGTARLLEVFLRRLEMPLDEMVGAIVDDLVAFRGGAIVKDDQTLLALEFVEAAAS